MLEPRQMRRDDSAIIGVEIRPPASDAVGRRRRWGGRRRTVALVLAVFLGMTRRLANFLGFLRFRFFLLDRQLRFFGRLGLNHELGLFFGHRRLFDGRRFFRFG